MVINLRWMDRQIHGQIDGEKEKGRKEGRKERRRNKNVNEVVASIKYVRMPPQKPLIVADLMGDKCHLSAVFICIYFIMS